MSKNSPSHFLKQFKPNQQTRRPKREIGARFGRLIIIEQIPAAHGFPAEWLCQCDCGNQTFVSDTSLSQGHTKSCGCLRQEMRGSQHPNFKHGLCETNAYNSWSGMISRCENPTNDSWKNYGGRGIQVCERWHDFMNFYADMGDRPSSLSIDRINNNGNYEPGNCRWATDKQQAGNKRTNIVLEYQGRTQILADWGVEFAIDPGQISMRVHRGWTLEEVVEFFRE